MRLVTWNARRGSFARKSGLIEHLEADVAVIQEIAAPESESAQTIWFGNNPKQGMAVITKGQYTLQRLRELPGVPNFVVPVAVKGPRSFVLFAVWTMGKQPMRYVEAAATAIDMYADSFAASPVVMMGDFNSNAIWDKSHPADLNHTAMVARLERHGLVSAYHLSRGIAHGLEPKPEHTFHLYGHEDKSYHIDYCFLPKGWGADIEHVVIGNYVDWRANSDHRPLIVTVRDET